MNSYPQYDFSAADKELAQLIPLDHPGSYPFHHFHAHTYSELLVFLKGGGIHNINFTEYPLKDGSAHLLSAGSIHWMERDPGSEGFIIVFKEQFLFKLQEFNPDLPYITLLGTSRVMDFSPKELEDLKSLMKELKESIYKKQTILPLIGHFFTKLALHLAKEPAESMPVPPGGLIADFYRLLQQHYREKLPAYQYAAMLHISPRLLNLKLKEVTGKTVAALQSERLLEEAKRMLIGTDLPMKKITDALGFSEPPHFMHWFKKQTGLTPASFRAGKISQ